MISRPQALEETMQPLCNYSFAFIKKDLTSKAIFWQEGGNVGEGGGLSGLCRANFFLKGTWQRGEFSGVFA
jgi:hypothetical protein